MARGYDIGGMLARSGQAQGQQMGQAYSQLGQSIGGMFGGIAGTLAKREERKKAESAQQQFQQILGAYQNNPDALRAEGQKMMTNKDPNMQRLGKMLMDEANRVQGVRTAQTTALETAGQDIQREAQRKRAMQVAMQAKDENALVALRANALDPVEYLSGRAIKEPGDKYKVVANRVFNTETGQYVEPSEAAELLPLGTLKDAVTPESLIEYVQTGDKSVLNAVEEEGRDDEATRSKLLATDSTLQTVKEASGLTGEVYPLFYDFSQFFPLTDARQLSNRVDTLKSVLSFDRLQQMRDESKTGGALGNVSNVELGLLGANLAALDPASGDFAQQLKKVETHYTNFKRALLGQKPLGDRYVEDEGILYYKDDEGDYVSLGKL